ncbi:DUF1254 domain-containing protein [Roseiarcus sp.]|uniref:DUF1254 domain-containing protein n=1 Tax=Roseiarcus sp. TaxID=1969460 RepID=UPI003F9733C5
MIFALLLAAAAAATAQPAPRPAASPPVPVTPDNFARAESDLNFAGLVKEAGLGKFVHRRDPTTLDHQGVLRMNRDTLYSAAVFDLDAGPVTITLPDAGKRFLSLQVIDEDADTPEVFYGAGALKLTKEAIGSRYALAAVRIFVDANDPKDVEAVRALQNAIKVDQPGGPGAFSVPNWEAASQVDVRTGLTVLAETLPDTRGMFGPRGGADPVRRLIGAGAAWGGLPEQDVLFFNVVPNRNDGRTVHRLTLKNVPVDGFWSVSVYDADGRFASNAQKAYTVNSVTAKAEPDGAVVVQFGGCDGHIPNCLPTPPDWSTMVRLYRPRAEALSGAWKLPAAEPVQ